MSHTMSITSFIPAPMAAHRPRHREKNNKKKLDIKQDSSTSKGFSTDRKDPPWRCLKGCGACCKLAKGPAFATPEDIFTDPSHIDLYRSLIGPDGWCVHYEKSTRLCSIYADRPFFCRVEPDVFHSLFGIAKKKFNKAACSSCRDTIKSVYGSRCEELENFNNFLKSSDSD